MALLSVSTWALNQQLGPLHWTRWDAALRRPVCQPEDQPRTCNLEDLPARLSAMGLDACELGHFHLPPLEEITPAYTAAVRQAFDAAGVRLWSLLVDYGDLSSADPRRRDADRQYLAEWVGIASDLGSQHIRFVAGEGSPDDPAAIERSVESLAGLAGLAEQHGVAVLTENFRRLCSTADVCTLICERLGGRVHLTADFGNFPRPARSTSLRAILPFARSIHAKVDNGPDGHPDTAEFARLLDLAADARFAGAYTVVAHGPGDQWAGVAGTADLIRAHPRALRG